MEYIWIQSGIVSSAFYDHLHKSLPMNWEMILVFGLVGCQRLQVSTPVILIKPNDCRSIVTS
jgi:hypothetical protein